MGPLLSGGRTLVTEEAKELLKVFPSVFIDKTSP